MTFLHSSGMCPSMLPNSTKKINFPEVNHGKSWLLLVRLDRGSQPLQTASLGKRLPNWGPALNQKQRRWPFTNLKEMKLLLVTAQATLTQITSLPIKKSQTGLSDLSRNSLNAKLRLTLSYGFGILLRATGSDLERFWISFNSHLAKRFWAR